MEGYELYTARYTDPQYTTIEVLWQKKDTTGGVIETIPYYIEVGSYDYNNLMKMPDMSENTLQNNTAEYKRKSSAVLSVSINAAARALAEQMIGTNDLKQEYNEIKQEYNEIKNSIQELGPKELSAVQRAKNTVFQYIWDSNEDKDELFKFKLWALELDIVRSASKGTKTELRKVKSIIKGLDILKSININ